MEARWVRGLQDRKMQGMLALAEPHACTWHGRGVMTIPRQPVDFVFWMNKTRSAHTTVHLLQEGIWVARQVGNGR
jgi:hypothetical protein